MVSDREEVGACNNIFYKNYILEEAFFTIYEWFSIMGLKKIYEINFNVCAHENTAILKKSLISCYIPPSQKKTGHVLNPTPPPIKTLFRRKSPPP